MAVTWTGLDRLLDDLTGLDTDLTGEAHAILTAGAEESRTAIAAAYPEHSGALRRGLVIRPAARGRLLAGGELVQTAPHGWIYEHGTKVRENKAGANRGQMPARPTFDPIAGRYHRSAIDAVIDRLYAHGAAHVTRAAT